MKLAPFVTPNRDANLKLAPFATPPNRDVNTSGLTDSHPLTRLKSVIRALSYSHTFHVQPTCFILLPLFHSQCKVFTGEHKKGRRPLCSPTTSVPSSIPHQQMFFWYKSFTSVPARQIRKLSNAVFVEIPGKNGPISVCPPGHTIRAKCLPVTPNGPLPSPPAHSLGPLSSLLTPPLQLRKFTVVCLYHWHATEEF